MAKKIGLGECLDIKLARLQKSDRGPTCYAINTDSQLQLELPSIQNGDDTLQCKYIFMLA